MDKVIIFILEPMMASTIKLYKGIIATLILFRFITHTQAL